MMRLTTFALALTLFTVGNAFTVLPSARMAPSSTSLYLMTPEETTKLITHATDCADGECSVDEVGDLITVLKSQQKELASRVDEIDKMIGSLASVNEKDERETDEVRETVRAIFRVFQLGAKASGNDYPALTKPTGYSGEVGKGATTAYDALPPKKWKAKP